MFLSIFFDFNSFAGCFGGGLWTEILYIIFMLMTKSYLIKALFFVTVLPKEPPTLNTDKNNYDIGDELRANCTSPVSRPVAALKFLLNNIVVRIPLIIISNLRNTVENVNLFSGFSA